jgi:outer membrane protein assembly factor BamB
MRLFILWLTAAALFAADDDWARWRGPNDDGMARGDAPLEWSDTRNIAWRIAIPGRGHSSPILWGDKLFLTTAVPTSEAPAAPAPAAGEGRRGAGGGAGSGQEHKFVVLALDRKTGKVLWERLATTATPHEGYHTRYGSFASNTPVTDGKYLYAHFGSRGLYCYDLDGKLVWQKQFEPMRMRLQFGEGAPTVIDENAVYLKFDQQQGSYMLALDKRTGKELWRVEREEESSWSPPLVVTHNGRKQVVVSATNRVQSYEPATGKLIWEAKGLGGNVIPAPVTARGIVYVMSGFRDPNLLAIRLGREGDLTGTDAIVWTNTRGNSYSASPVLHEDKLYFVTDNGTLSCLNAQTGQPYYQQQRLPKPYSFKSSPVGANGKLYLATEDGDVVVVKMGEKYEVLATNSLTDQSFIRYRWRQHVPARPEHTLLHPVANSTRMSRHVRVFSIAFGASNLMKARRTGADTSISRSLSGASLAPRTSLFRHFDFVYFFAIPWKSWARHYT